MSTPRKCICRVFSRDIPFLCKEFSLDKDAVQKAVKKKDGYSTFPLTRGVFLVKYFVSTHSRGGG